MEVRQLDLFDFNGLPIIYSIVDAFPNTEFEELEYKSAQGGFPNDFWKTYSAFANTSGGIIVLGVSEKKNSFNIEGLSDEQIIKIQKDFWNSANNPDTVNINLLRNEDVRVIETEGKKLLAFNVPLARRNEKPVFLTKNPFKNTYKRNFEGDYRCTDVEVRRMLADADTNLHHDSRILENFTIDDIDLNSLRKYRQLFSANSPSHTWLVLDDIELLKKIGGYRVDRNTKTEGFTLAGLVMFGKESSITDKECVPNFFPDFREILSDDENIRWTDRIYPDGTWEANLFEFYLKVWPVISSKLPKPFQMEKGRRRDETPTHEALREAFVNTLVHTDYSAQGNIIIEMRKDRYTFSNPGTLLVSKYQYYMGGVSECRNPNIQKMFMMMGGAEKAGSGVNKIMSGWEYAHWRRPYIETFTQPDRIELHLPMFSMIPEETLSELKEIFGDGIISIGKDELTILSFCQIEGEITNNRLQNNLQRHKVDITQMLQELCKRGYLVSENSGRWTTYHLNKNFKIGPQNVDTLNVDTSNVDTLNVDTSKNIRSGLNEKILAFCNHDFKTVKEIAVYTERTESHLKNRIIKKLLEEGSIARKYPDKVNHPDQAYRTVH
ncbi:RNA-binding domain-containing protein [Elizabethkingia anophelis]|uniref:RNA-binding domain-containing protein n=1 Tax=Elizabethkingia anophelis TaxID=1117645 RepID=UPI000999D015|nr:RNA-binding domain-containing protein [Elizabethkingia anophelis]OPC30744.1 hypothetical protein BAX98_09050 [Elizabethkingia anophelis]